MIAAFIARDPSPTGQVAASAGVGTAFRFSQPGRTVVEPCPLIRSHSASHPAQLAATSEPSGIGAGAALIALGGLLTLALGGLGGLLIARRRMT